MNQIKLNDQILNWKNSESLLDALDRQKVAIPSSCRAGACHTCLVRAVNGNIPPESQIGLKATLKEQGFLLACICKKSTDLTISLAGEGLSSVVKLTSKNFLSKDVAQLRFKTDVVFDFRAGQFISLIREDGLIRSYSIASIPEDGFIELHVRLVTGGVMSNYLFSTATVGDLFKVRGPHGDCFYLEGRTDQPLVLLGTGTGLAPLAGIARDALKKGHRGLIYLIHGGREKADLYFHSELLELSSSHPNFFYIPTLSTARNHDTIRKGRVLDAMHSEIQNLKGFRVFLCGSPEMVSDAKKDIYKNGVELEDIFADAFIQAHPATSKDSERSKEKSKTHPKTFLKLSKKKPPELRKTKADLASWIQKARFSIQALTLAGFITQGILFYETSFRPFGNLFPFMAYDSLGQRVVSSSLIVWSILFILIALFGRFACGWFCPFGFIQDAGQKILELLKINIPKPIHQPRFARLLMAIMVLSHFIVLPLLAVPNPVWQSDWFFREPWLLGFPFRLGLFLLDLVAVFVTLGLIMPYFLGPRPYCKMVCETGYLMGLAAKWSFGKIRRNEGFDRDTCLSCLKCTSICPQNIQVHEEVHLFDRVVSDNCISCLQCVGTCPNDTIVYSLRPKVADTGRVAGYLASLGSKTIDTPRFVLTTIGVALGGWVGFKVIPSSYLHTYLLFASFGGLGGFFIWRLIGIFLGERFISFQPNRVLSRVEKESKERILPLSPAERTTATSSKKKIALKILVSIGLLIFMTMALIGIVTVSTPPRILEIESLPVNNEVDRQKRILLAVPQISSIENTYKTFSYLPHYLEKYMDKKLAIATGKTYSSLTVALLENRVHAAIVPAGTAYSMIRRHSNEVECVGHFTLKGSPYYKGLLLSRKDLKINSSDFSRFKIALVSLESVSGYYRPLAWFREKNISLSDFDQVILTGIHTQTLQLLSSGKVDIAATFDGALINFEQKNDALDFQILAEFPDLPREVLLVRKEARMESFVNSLNQFTADNLNTDYKEQLSIGAGYDGFFKMNPCNLESLSKWIE